MSGARRGEGPTPFGTVGEGRDRLPVRGRSQFHALAAAPEIAFVRPHDRCLGAQGIMGAERGEILVRICPDHQEVVVGFQEGPLGDGERQSVGERDPAQIEGAGRALVPEFEVIEIAVCHRVIHQLRHLEMLE